MEAAAQMAMLTMNTKSAQLRPSCDQAVMAACTGEA